MMYRCCLKPRIFSQIAWIKSVRLTPPNLPPLCRWKIRQRENEIRLGTRFAMNPRDEDSPQVGLVRLTGDWENKRLGCEGFDYLVAFPGEGRHKFLTGIMLNYLKFKLMIPTMHGETKDILARMIGLVATSGAKGDGKLFLWNALRGRFHLSQLFQV